MSAEGNLNNLFLQPSIKFLLNFHNQLTSGLEICDLHFFLRLIGIASLLMGNFMREIFSRNLKNAHGKPLTNVEVARNLLSVGARKFVSGLKVLTFLINAKRQKQSAILYAWEIALTHRQVDVSHAKTLQKI